MKPVNWDNSRIRNLVDHGTPFKEIELPERRTIRLYWTKGGEYGPQVAALLYGGEDVLYEVTGGCGYNKEYSALEYCFHELGKAPRGFKRHDQELYNYHVGGNFYRVPKKHWLKY